MKTEAASRQPCRSRGFENPPGTGRQEEEQLHSQDVSSFRKLPKTKPSIVFARRIKMGQHMAHPITLGSQIVGVVLVCRWDNGNLLNDL